MGFNSGFKGLREEERRRVRVKKKEKKKW